MEYKMAFNKKSVFPKNPQKKVTQKSEKKDSQKTKKKKDPHSIELTPDYRPEEINWYPGHMEKALKQIKDKIKLVDIVLEIRDARAPLASGNEVIIESLQNKGRLILLNKANLADPRSIILWEKWFKDQGVPFLFLNCFEKGSLKKVMVMARQIVDEKKRAANPETFVSRPQLRLMVLGIPNTGKSTLINQLTSRAATRTGDRPGHTKVQQWINFNDEIYLLDTPGVIPPTFENVNHRLWLCALHAVPDSLLGEESPARFLIKYFLEIRSQQFLERFKFSSFDLSVEEALQKIAVLRGCLMNQALPDLDRVYKLILMDFRNGELGKCCFELPHLIRPRKT